MFPFGEPGAAVVLSLVAVPPEDEDPAFAAPPGELLPLEGIEVTLPDESPELFSGITRLEVPGDASDRSLVETALLVETELPLSPETVAADPRESLNSAERDWAGMSLVRLELPALAESGARLPAGAEEALSPLTVPV